MTNGSPRLPSSSPRSSKTKTPSAAPAFAKAETMLAVLQRVTDEQKSHVLLLEVGLPGRSGLEIIADVHKHAPQCGIVILTVFEDEDKISRAAAVA